jgi:S1-C subfamily serine protease
MSPFPDRSLHERKEDPAAAEHSRRSGSVESGGIQSGNLITAIGSRKVGAIDNLHSFLDAWTIGVPLTIEVIRGSIDHLSCTVVSKELLSAG